MRYYHPTLPRVQRWFTSTPVEVMTWTSNHNFGLCGYRVFVPQLNTVLVELYWQIQPRHLSIFRDHTFLILTAGSCDFVWDVATIVGSIACDIPIHTSSVITGELTLSTWASRMEECNIFIVSSKVPTGLLCATKHHVVGIEIPITNMKRS